MKRKITSLLLAVCLVLACIPAEAFATETAPLDISAGNIVIDDDGASVNGELKATGGEYVVTGTTDQYALNIQTSDKVKVTFRDLTIIHDGDKVSVNSGHAQIVLEGVSEIGYAGKTQYASVYVNPNAVIEFSDESTGSLNTYCATDSQEGGNSAAAIGAHHKFIIKNDKNAGTIIINGGTITARSGYGSAAIGGGNGTDVKSIQLNGGTIQAIGGMRASGIGSGKEAAITEELTFTHQVSFLGNTTITGWSSLPDNIKANDIDEIYNGNSYSINVVNAPADKTITYSTDGITYTAGPLVFQDAVDNTVYYKVSSDSKSSFLGMATVTIRNAEQTAPNVAAVNETVSGKNDGKITNVTANMEYRKSDASNYTAVTGETIEGLTCGTYYVRYAAKQNYNVSKDTTVTVEKGDKLRVTIPGQQTGYTLTASEKELDWNGDVKLMFSLAEGYSKAKDFAVKVNGSKTAVFNDDGTLTIHGVTNDIEVTVEGVVKYTNNTEAENKETNPQTGDNSSSVVLWLALLTASCIALRWIRRKIL